MGKDLLWHVAVATCVDAEEAVGALFEQLFEQPAVVYVEEETKAASVSVYLDRLPGKAAEIRTRLRDGLSRINAGGRAIRHGTVRIRQLRREDWVESWKRHFKPVAIGRSLLIKPGWSRRKAARRQALVVLDPGLSFGTGQHPTTQFCLQQLVAHRKPAFRQALLDIGTGSGILAIAGAKLGYQPVCAFDFDSVAVRAAKANARRNRVRSRIQVRRQDLSSLPVRSDIQFDIICANLTSDVLLTQARKLVNRLVAGGTLLLSGVLVGQFDAIQGAYAALGLSLKTTRVKGEWQSGVFVAGQRALSAAGPDPL